nr:asparaginase [Brevibacillus reuszeri]
MMAFGGRIIGKAGVESAYGLGGRDTDLGIAVKIEDRGARA